MDEIWIWQRIVTPHVAALASALARKGCTVTYVAEQELSDARVKLGWQVPDLQGVRLKFVSDSGAVKNLVQEAPSQSVHLCQGIRSNGRISTAQRALAKHGLRQWVVMEAVNDAGATGRLKRWIYERQFSKTRRSLQGVLAIGFRTVDWVIARGISGERVFPFAYFLLDVGLPEPQRQRQPGSFRFLFVGQFILRKRLDLLIRTLQTLMDRRYEFWVVGTGPQEKRLRRLAESILHDRVRWLGRRFQAEARSIMGQADCLVLPSRFDGWGAVISEAMMMGTPVICSDACGAAGVVKASGFGAVYQTDHRGELRARLDEQLKSGPISTKDRIQLASWASVLRAEAGARYLLSILNYATKGGSRPMPPWHTAKC